MGYLLLQKPHLALGPDGLLVKGSGLVPGPVHGGGAAVHLPQVLLGAPGYLLQLPLYLPVLCPGKVYLVPVLPDALGGPAQGLEPDAYLKALLLPVVLDKLLRLLGLLLQGAHPALKLA